MPTYYAFNGFTVDIYRQSGSQFSGKIYLDGTLIHTIVPGSNLIRFYLLHIRDTNGRYTFDLENTSATDPLKFEVSNYETGNLITEVTFPLETPLILIAGIDGEASTNLSIKYPLKSFTFANPTKLKVIWYCLPWSPGCDGLKINAEGLPEPKIIGNLTGCSTEIYKGDLSQNVVCENKESGQYYLFSIYNSGTLLYSRLECCCPTVVPEETPEKVGFVCTCPDWGKATSYNQTLFSSSERLRQWVQSGAGSKADCKHIMAAKRIMGIEQPIYTDPSYSAPPPPATPG